jgi:hypothetical protein
MRQVRRTNKSVGRRLTKCSFKIKGAKHGGCREIGIFPARYEVRVATNVAATRLAVTTPPLTRVLDRLIGGGISFSFISYD